MNAPIIAMLHDTSRNRFHPIVFLNAPLPGGHDGGRYKSKMHHTTGFDTHEAALANIRDELTGKVREVFGEPKTALTASFPWDGQGIPAMSTLFVESPDGIRPVSF